MEHTAHTPLLVLIGFMGAGKTTVGRLLAQQLHCPFHDLDVEIERVHGAIPKLFETYGESGFRAIEHHTMDQLLPRMRRPSVLALGGGAFLQPANRELLRQHGGVTIFLDAPWEVVLSRVRHTGEQRPLARDLDALRQLYELRRPVYLQADHIFSSAEHDPHSLLTSLVRLAEELGARHQHRATL